ncbi:peptidoglycan recognition protein [Kitasatospora sp. NPDC088346]|uniref:peptidoglycan recognition protein family protein n=1 Tax=Kitasatospora sp. NPDC088346 TaxID=3364073 RepID=UPI0037F4A082
MDINRRSVLRRAVQAASAGAAVALAAAGPPRHLLPFADHGPTTPELPALALQSGALPAPLPPPPVVRRSTWKTDEPETQTLTDPSVRVVFIHHTGDRNEYGPQDVPEILKSIYQEHRENQGWDDIGYNFLVDRFGTIYEGRLGSTGRPVVGAHTLGFNRETMGIAAIGSYDTGIEVPTPVIDAMARLAAWKLGTYGFDPQAKAELTSNSSGSRFPEGTNHTFDTISGHRDAFCTLCPGDSLYAELPRIIERAAGFLHGAAPAVNPAQDGPGRGRFAGIPSGSVLRRPQRSV